MASPLSDPYAVLGVTRGASEADIRSAYRRAVQREHPDHNGGSLDAARRFETVQEAWAQIRLERARADTGAESRTETSAARETGGATAAQRPRATTSGADPPLDARLADLERQLAEARAARERATRAAREAAREATRSAGAGTADRPSDEELGYYTTDDSIGAILSDVASELRTDAREHRVPKRLSDLIDEIGSKLTGDPPDR